MGWNSAPMLFRDLCPLTKNHFPLFVHICALSLPQVISYLGSLGNIYSVFDSSVYA